MHAPSRVWCLMSGIHAGRLRLAEQFATMDGWQHKADPRFDAFIAEKRRAERFEGFDQRVERGFAAALRLHRAEIQNAVKRRLKSSGARFTSDTLRDVRAAVETRTVWLREVWAQIDADYRSPDSARQATAAREITAALRGTPSDYMRWVYTQQHARRFLGPMGQTAQDDALQDDTLPDVTEEEADRHHHLRLRMSSVERAVRGRYGAAGQQHWAELQRAKDDAYAAKLDDAAAVFAGLLGQEGRHAASRRTEAMREHVSRVHTAQVRFKAAMALERERERLLEAHAAMALERRRVEKARRVAALSAAAEERSAGCVAAQREERVGREARRQAERHLAEHEALRRRQAALLEMLASFKDAVEGREGREMLQPQRTRAGRSLGFDEGMDESISSSNPDAVEGTRGEAHNTPAETHAMDGLSAQTQKAALWRSINADTYEDPFHTVHQARLDADRTYDPIYAQTFPLNLVLGRKYSRQGAGEMAAGNETDRLILQKGNDVARNFMWGVDNRSVHDLDADGSKDYFMNGSFHVRDKSTGDIDWRYEKKRGGATFRGPKFYRLGEKREAKDPGERTMDPTPYQPIPPEHQWHSS